MNTPGLVTALLLPALLGISWLQLFWRHSHLAARIGYGYLLGVFAVTTLLRIWDSIGFSFAFIPISTLIIVLSLPPLVLGYRRRSTCTSQSHYAPFDASWQKVVWGLLLAILVIRYSGILFEIVWRPLYPWDAWMNWAPKAKTWFELKELAPFVNRDDWIAESMRHGTYLLGNSQASTYPPLVPLIQTWTALGIGSWVDNLVNIPWIMCLVSLGLSFYGQARMIGAKPLTTLLWLLLLLSIPYINTHTALAGYADLWLATYFCLAVMAFMHWALTKDNKQGIFIVLFALACTQTKEPGIIWAAALLPAITLAMLPGRWRYAVTVIAIICGVLIYNHGFSIQISDATVFSLSSEHLTIPGRGTFIVEYHPIGSSFLANDLIWDNWHLLGWVIFIILPPLFWSNIVKREMMAPTILILLIVLFMVVIFFFTNHYAAALDNTTINRATIHLLPALLYYLLFSHSHYPNQINPKAAV